MKNKSTKSIIFAIIAIMFYGLTFAQKTATVKINSSATFQKVTGFGGFVNSPQFGYNHMTTDEIKKLWGKNSDAGYNIMRMYIPTGETSWPQCLATAQLAKSLGIIIFASPWSMPAEWKTNNNIAAVFTDSSGVEQIGYLKDEYYDDYALYLNNFVTYLRNNGVELDAISIQNEPDWKATYAGCIWTPEQMAKFIKNYGSLINCKIIAPEGAGFTDEFANALLTDSVSAEFDIFAGHQYGAIQKDYIKLQQKGKELWMTEYLINWNQDESTTRNFKWSTDAFTFANKLNVAMLSNINAWIHYASKRYYGLMGDGTNGSTTGVITKRGHILSHFAKYTIGTTRIENFWLDDSNILQGSSYLSVSGDSVIVMVINPSSNAYNVTVDLPFFTSTGKSIITTETLNMAASAITISEETFRPKVTINASSFTTLIFTKSNDRPVSEMTGEQVHYNKIDNQIVTNAAFGTNFKLSGKTVTFDVNRLLISSNKTAANGYLQLDDRYTQLVFHIETITSAMNYTSANTTLYYINNSGTVSSYNYGTINFNQNGSFDWVLDISRSKLTDGCKGILGISNSNYSSILTIKFGDVYFKLGNEKTFKFSGIYSNCDSYLYECLEDVNYTSVDFTGTSGISSVQNWALNAANKNCLFYVASEVTNNNNNVISGTSCDTLELNDLGGDFYVPFNFTATSASYSRTFNGYGIMVLPFEATIPEGVKAYTILASATEVTCTLIADSKILANTPVLIVGTGNFVFTGTGNVSTPHALSVNNFNGVYISVKAPANSYYLNKVGDITAFYKVSSGSEPLIIPFSAYLAPGNSSLSYLPINLSDVTGMKQLKKEGDGISGDDAIYDLMGRRIYQPQKGVIYIQNRKKFILN